MYDKQSLDEFLTQHSDLLAKIMDVLIPADPELEMPSATEIGVLDKYLRAALTRRDDLAPPFMVAIGRAAGLERADLDGLLTLPQEDFSLISRVIAGAYFMDTCINAKLRYFGQVEIRENVDYDEIIALIEAPMERGVIYTRV